MILEISKRGVHNTTLTKTCSVCGHKNTGLKLKDRVWTCDNCNTIHNRDYNVAINIKQEGLRLVGLV
jgi:putative transposase